VYASDPGRTRYAAEAGTRRAGDGVAAGCRDRVAAVMFEYESGLVEPGDGGSGGG